MLEYRQINLREYEQAIDALVKLHWDEVGSKSPRRLLAPDYDVFYKLEQAGVLILVGVLSDGVLVGYAANILSKDTHAKEFVVSYNDALYLHPEYRKGKAGIGLIKTMEALSRTRGAMAVTWHAKPDTPLMHLLSKRDYSIKDIVFMKEV